MIIESTANELRKTGISVIGDVRWGTHFCYFYETKQDLLDTLVPYFKAGLENREFCLWVVSPPLTVEEAKRALGQAVSDLDHHLRKDDLEIRGHDEWYLHNGEYDPKRVIQAWREKLNQALVSGYAGLRASGDGGWVQKDEWMVFRDYEKQVDALIADQRRLLLCTYSLITSSGAQIFDAARIHQMAVARRNGSWEMVETPVLKEAKAEIQRLNEELEQKVQERTRELATTNEALRDEIVERKLAEEAVKQAEDRIRLVIDTIPTMAWSLRPDGVLDFVNQRWLDYTGLSFQDAIREPNGIVHPEDLPRVMEKWLVTKAAREMHEDEMRLRRADGEYCWFLVRTAPLRDEQGNLVKWYGASIDIEDRKQAEMQSRVLIDVIPQQIWSAPPDGKTDYCNDRWRSYTGLELEDLRGYGWQIMVHPEDRDRVLRAWRESVASGTPYEQEERHRGTDGTYRWFLSLGVPLRDAEGRIVRWYGTNTDIEDRKRVEEALRESETRFRQVAENISAVFWLSNPEATLLHYVSPAYEKIWGRSCDSLYAEPRSWMDSVHPDDRECLAEDERLQAVGGRHDHTYRIVRPDGSLRWIRGRAFPVRDEAGKLIRVAGIAEDITEHKEAEERLRRSEEKFKALFDLAPVGISVLDRQRHLIDANPALEQITRLSKEELLSGAHLRCAILNADGTPKLPHEFPSARAIKENRPISNIVTGIVIENGETVWLQVSVAPLALSDMSAVVVTQDITERKRAAEELEEANRQLRILSRQLFHIQEEERRHLARELHDEIGQTLTAAKINLKIIAPDVPAKVTGRLDDSIELLDRLLRQVRQLSLDLRPPLLDELGLVPTLRWLVDQQAQRAGLRLTFTANIDGLEIDPDVQTACFRVAQEAITNIIRHSGAKSLAVEVRREAERLTLSVRDDGAGFDPAAIQQRAAQHSTLGLVSMKERVLLVRGGLEVNSVPSQGTEIRAWFPLTFGQHPSTTDTA
jgi:PAS domain S-box-containing protein